MTSRFLRITGRISKTILVLAVLGSLIATFREGWRFAIGFLLGASLSYLSVWRWIKVVSAVGGEVKARRTALLVIRFGLVAAGAYVIINSLAVSAVAVFLGLLVPGIAVLITLFFELIYGT